MGLLRIFREKPLWVIVATVFLDQLGWSIFLPIFPLIFSDSHSPFYILKTSLTPQSGLFLMGALLGAYPLAQFLAAPILGYFSDTVGRKKILVISIFGTFLSYLLAAFAIFTKNLPLLFAARIFDGLTGGNISVAQAVITDVSDKDGLPKNFGLIMAMAGLGMILGPFIGGVLSDSAISPSFNPTTPFLFVAILYLINTLFVLTVLPETLKMRVKANFDLIKPFKSLFNIFRYKHLWSLFSARFAYSSGSIIFTSFIGAYLVVRYAFSAHQLGFLYGLVGLWLVLTQGIFIRFIPKKTKEEVVVKISLLVAAFSMVLFLSPMANQLLLVLIPPLAISFGLVDAYLLAFISKRTDAKLQGEVLGIMTSLRALAQAVSPLAAGTIAAAFSLSWTIIAAAVIILISWVLFFVGKAPEYTHS